MLHDYDLLIIGAGSGGVRAARVAAALGQRVGIVEQQYLGGTCVNVGCVPKKIFTYSANYHDYIKSSAGFGWSLDGEFSWATLTKNTFAYIERLNKVYERLLSQSGVHIHRAKSRIKSEHEVYIDDQVITAKHILVATGSVAQRPDFPGSEHVLLSNDMFNLTKLPQHMVVIGGGYIAVEFAVIFAQLGVKVTLLYRGDLFLQGFDEGARKALAAEIGGLVDLRFNSEVSQVQQVADTYHVVLKDSTSIETDLVFAAIGRKPNTEYINIKELGVDLNERGGIIVNDHYQSSIKNIYAVGDVIDRLALTPVAIYEAKVCINHLYGDASENIDYANVPSVVFSHPALAQVGLTEKEARERVNGTIDIYESKFTPMRYAVTSIASNSYIKMLVERDTDRVLGLHIVDKDAAEIIQGLAVGMTQKLTKKQLDDTIAVHPTVAEEFVLMTKPTRSI